VPETSPTPEESDERFERYLDSLLQALSDETTPTVRAFVKGVRARNAAFRARGDMESAAQYLVGDLVGILSDFELRLKALEIRADEG